MSVEGSFNFLSEWENSLMLSWKKELSDVLKKDIDTITEDYIHTDADKAHIDDIETAICRFRGTIFREGLNRNIDNVCYISQINYLLNTKLQIFRSNALPYIVSEFIPTPVVIEGKDYIQYVCKVDLLDENQAIFALIPAEVSGDTAIIPDCTELDICKYFFTHNFRQHVINGQNYCCPQGTVPIKFSVATRKEFSWIIEKLPFTLRTKHINFKLLSEIIKRDSTKDLPLRLDIHHARFDVTFSDMIRKHCPKSKFRLNLVTDHQNLKIWGHRSGWPAVLHAMSTVSDAKGTPVHFVDLMEDIFSWRIVELETNSLKHIHYSGRDYHIPWENVKVKGGTHVAKLPDGVIVNYKEAWQTQESPSPEEFDKLKCIKDQSISIPWMGFLHNPQNMPKWFDYCNSPEEILKRAFFLKSLPYCHGIFTLSKYLGDWLRVELSKIIDKPPPVFSLIHPTEIPEITFNLSKFLLNKNKLLIQVGYWLRLRTAINHISGVKDGAEVYKKLWLYGAKHALDLLDVESEEFKTSKNFDGVYIERVDNDVYDYLFSCNLIFLYIIESSANNAIIECMARNTPVVVNRHPAIVEYLGPEYPLFYDTMAQAQELIFNYELISKAHYYMIDNKLAEKVMFKHFISRFRDTLESINPEPIKRQLAKID